MTMHSGDSAKGAGTAEVRPPVLSEFQELTPPAVQDEEESWVMPVLRTEARLRLGEAYISETRKWYDRGLAAPADLDVDIELQALAAHEYGEETLDQYRLVARRLPEDVRSSIFFLRANDRLFRSEAKLVGESLRGALLRPVSGPSCKRTSLEEALQLFPRTIIVASTSS